MSGSDNGGGKGNGADLAAIYGAVLAISADLNTVREELGALDRKVDRGLAALRAEMHAENASLRADVAALRGDVTAYHASVVGHGALVSELDERVSRLERGEPPKAA